MAKFDFKKIEQLKNIIVDNNRKYRLGNPEISDSAYDDLLEQFEKLVDVETYDTFRKSLNEGMIETDMVKVHHPFIMGSLDKIKNSDEKTLDDFLKNRTVSGKLNASAKVDGISCRLHYSSGKLVQASTRGDGYDGMDITNKISYVVNVPKRIDFTNEIDIRGELVIKKDVKVDSDTNTRNICAGIINRKDFIPSDIASVSFIAYTILGDEYSKDDQFRILDELGFETAVHVVFNVEKVTSEILTGMAKMNYTYATDGLVLMDGECHNENEYRPKNAMAFKINELIAETTVRDIVFDGPTKDGYFIPVAVVEPTELGGSVIERSTLHNLDYIRNLGVAPGCRVTLQKMNDIIPAITSVISDENSYEIKSPEYCPVCGTKIVKDELNYRCPNEGCSGRTSYQINHFLSKMGVENVQLATLKNLGISSFDDLLGFRPDNGYKTQTKFYTELNEKVFSSNARDIFCAMNFEGLSTKLLGKIVDHLGWNNVYENLDMAVGKKLQNEYREVLMTTSLPKGIGMQFMGRFSDGCFSAFTNMSKIIADPRFTGTINGNTAQVHFSGGTFCVTGSLEFGTRNEFIEYARTRGWEFKSGVSKGLDYLVNNDKESGSAKNTKARNLGIKIVSEKEFLSIIG